VPVIAEEVEHTLGQWLRRLNVFSLASKTGILMWRRWRFPGLLQDASRDMKKSLKRVQLS